MPSPYAQRPTPLLLGAVALAGLLGCGRDDAAGGAPPAAATPPTTWPAGTVLALGTEPVLAEEVDRHLDLIHLVEPHLVRSDHRRKALTNIVLPTVAARLLAPEERQAAFEHAQALAAEARETGRAPAGAPEPTYLTGTWKDVGMTLWDEARRTEPGAFTALIETPGAWTFAHVLAVGVEPGEPFGPTTQITVQRYDVPFLEREGTRALLQSTIDQLGLQVVDPEWAAVVPGALLYPSRPTDG